MWLRNTALESIMHPLCPTTPICVALSMATRFRLYIYLSEQVNRSAYIYFFKAVMEYARFLNNTITVCCADTSCQICSWFDMLPIYCIKSSNASKWYNTKYTLQQNTIYIHINKFAKPPFAFSTSIATTLRDAPTEWRQSGANFPRPYPSQKPPLTPRNPPFPAMPSPSSSYWRT